MSGNFKKTEEKLNENKDTKVIVCLGEVRVPHPSEREALIKEAHDTIVSGHRAFLKTVKHLRTKDSWENIRDEIQDYKTVLTLSVKKNW